MTRGRHVLFAVLTVVIAVAIGGGVGCSTNVPLEPVESSRPLVDLGRTAPLPFRVLVAPLEDARGRDGEVSGAAALAKSPARAGAPGNGNAGGGGGAGDEEGPKVAPVPQFEAEAFRDEVVEALRVARVFDPSAIVKAPPPTLEEAERIARSPTGALKYQQALLESEWAGRHDLLLKLRLQGYDVKYMGPSVEHRGRHFFSVFAFINWYFPAWWIADEEYACELKLEASIVAVGSERPLYRKEYAARVASLLDDFERGLTLLGPFGLRSSLDEEHWRKVANVLAPRARRAVEVELATDLKAWFAADAKAPGRPPPDLATITSVVVGAGHFDPKTRRVDAGLYEAEEDASRVHELLVGDNAGGGIVPVKNATRLLGGEATREKIVDALRQAVRRSSARPRDHTLYFYFAGFGATWKGEVCLVPFDFDPKAALATGLGLRELARILNESPCRQVVVIDASFGGGAGERTLSFPGVAAEVPTPAAFDSLKRADRVVVLSAGRQGRARTTSKSGAFTGILLEHVRNPKTAANPSGFVTLNAVFEKVREDTRAADESDTPQDPEWLSLARGPRDAKEIEVPLLRRAPVPAPATTGGRKP